MYLMADEEHESGHDTHCMTILACPSEMSMRSLHDNGTGGKKRLKAIAERAALVQEMAQSTTTIKKILAIYQGMVVTSVVRSRISEQERPHIDRLIHNRHDPINLALRHGLHFPKEEPSWRTVVKDHPSHHLDSV